MPTLKEALDSFSGQGGKQAVREAGGLQTDAARRALILEIGNLVQSREDFSPFLELGTGQIDELQQSIGELPTATTAQQANLGPLATQGGRQAIGGAVGLLGQAGEGRAGAFRDLQTLGGETLQPRGLNINALDTDFFRAQEAQNTRNIVNLAASRGKRGAGGTAVDIGRSSLLLGEQFAREDLNNTLAANAQRFGQVGSSLDALRQGRNLGFEGTRQANLFGQGAQAQQFGQLERGTEGANAIQQQDFLNQLTLQGQDVSQLRGLLDVGQASAAGQAANSIGGGVAVSSLLTDLTNIQNARRTGQAQAGAQGGSNITGAILGGLSLFDDEPGAQVNQRTGLNPTGGF